MQVAQTKLMRIVDDDGIHIGYINTACDNVCTDKHIIFLIDKINNSFFKVMTLHLPVGIPNAEIRTQTLDNICHLRKAADAIEYKKHLASPFRFKINSITYNVFVVHLHFCLYWLTIGWRSINNTEIPCTHQRKLQSPWYRGSCQC